MLFRSTFMFMIDDRFFGTLTAYVPGEQAAQYEFTSGLPVRLLGYLMPTLSPLLDAPVPDTAAAPPTPASAPVDPAAAPST